MRLTKLYAVLNAVIALGKIGMGIYSLSIFLCISGLYTIGIVLAKAVATRGYADSRKKPDEGHSAGYRKEEYRCYSLVGHIIFFTSLVYMLYCTRMLLGAQSAMRYTSLMVVVIGSITGAEFGMSLQGIIAARRNREPVIEAIMLTSFVSALISLELTQTAILSYSGPGSSIYFNLTGMFLGDLSAATGIYMIIRIVRIKRIFFANKRASAIGDAVSLRETAVLSLQESNMPKRYYALCFASSTSPKWIFR